MVDPPTAPVVDNPGDQSSTTGSTVSLQVVATPVTPGDVLQFAAAGLPAGLSLDASSGQITGQPTAAGTSNVTVTVTDAGGEREHGDVRLGRSPTRLPTVANPGRQATNVGDAVSLQIVAQAPAGNDGRLRRHRASRPASRSMPATGLISGAPTAAGVQRRRRHRHRGRSDDRPVHLGHPRAHLRERRTGRAASGSGWFRPDGIDAPTGWPGAVRAGDPQPGRLRARPGPGAPRAADAATPAARGGHLGRGRSSGADVQAFRIERVASTGVVTIGRRPLGVDLSLRLHRTLTSLSFDLLVTSPSGASTAVFDVSLDPISDRYLLAEGVVPDDLVVVDEPRLPLFALPRRMGSAGPSRWPTARSSTSTRSAARTTDAPSTLLERVDEVSMVCVPDAARYDEGRPGDPPGDPERAARPLPADGRPHRDLRSSADPAGRRATRGPDRQRRQRPAVDARASEPSTTRGCGCIGSAQHGSTAADDAHPAVRSHRRGHRPHRH